MSRCRLVPVILLATIWWVFLANPDIHQHLWLLWTAPGQEQAQSGSSCAEGQLEWPKGTCVGVPLDGRFGQLRVEGDRTPPRDDSTDLPALAWNLISRSGGLSDEIQSGIVGSAANSEITGETRNFLALARRGENLDSGNAFFPWMAAAAEFGLGDRTAALGDLKRAAGCHRYDDYLSNYNLANFHVLVGNHLLSPWRIERILWDQSMVEEVSGPVNAALSARGGMFSPSSSIDPRDRQWLLHLGRLQRQTSCSIYCQAVGAVTEMAAIDPVNGGPPFYDWLVPPSIDFGSHVGMIRPFPSPPPLASPERAEWDQAAKFLNVDYPTLCAPPPIGSAVPWVIGERLEWLLLATLPLCLGLWLAQELACGLFGSEPVNVWRWTLFGACLGMLLLCLVWGCEFAMMLPPFPPKLYNMAVDSQGQPGILGWMPHVIWLLAGMALSGATYLVTIQRENQEVARVEADVFSQSKCSGASASPFVCLARASLPWICWLIPPALIFSLLFVFCQCRFTNNYINMALDASEVRTGSPGASWVSRYLGCFLLVWYVGPWVLHRSKDGKRLRKRVRSRLRAVFMGYLVLASLLVVIFEGGRLEWRQKADRVIEASLLAGSGGTLAGWNFDVLG